MVTVIAKNFIDESKVDIMMSLCEDLISETIKEKGCISYELFRNIKNKGEFTFIEEWDSKEALEIHMNSQHFKRIVPLIKELSIQEGSVCLYKNVSI